MSFWSQEEGLSLCVLLEAVCQSHNYHVALTGGLLYKHGPRKDCDILFYSVRQVDDVSPDELMNHLQDTVTGFSVVDRFGWVFKVTYHDKNIDVFFPEEPKLKLDGNSGE